MPRRLTTTQLPIGGALAHVTFTAPPSPRGSDIHSIDRPPVSSSTIGRPAGPAMVHSRMTYPFGTDVDAPATHAPRAHQEFGGAVSPECAAAGIAVAVGTVGCRTGNSESVAAPDVPEPDREPLSSEDVVPQLARTVAETQ